MFVDGISIIINIKKHNFFLKEYSVYLFIVEYLVFEYTRKIRQTVVIVRLISTKKVYSA